MKCLHEKGEETSIVLSNKKQTNKKIPNAGV